MRHSDGVDVIEADQTTGGNRWILLGRYAFDAGAEGHIVVSNPGGGTYLRTSAVKFVPVE